MNVERDRFKRIIRALHKRSRPEERLAFNQVANIALNDGDPTHAGYVAQIAQHPLFKEYFEATWDRGLEGKSGRLRVNWPAVARDWPSLLDQPLAGDVFAIMKRALDDEEEAVRRAGRGASVEVRDGKPLVGIVPDPKIAVVEYTYAEEDAEEDAPFPFAEGISVQVKHPDGRPHVGTLLAVDQDTRRLIVRFDGPGGPNKGRLRERKEALVRAKKSILDRVSQRRGPFQRLLGTPPPVPRLVAQLTVDGQFLDPSQARAVQRAGEQDLTVIWGPPGTGKTRTVGELVAHLVHAKKRVLVAAIANVAVDQAALATCEALERHGWTAPLQGGEVLRLGYAADPRCLAEGRLFPNKDESRRIRAKILELQKKLAANLLLHDRATTLDELERRNRELAQVTATAISRARVVLTTVHQTALEKTFREEERFDVVILDEASMVSVLDAFIAASRADHQIVLCGDFRQLGPIAAAGTDAAFRTLHKDILTHLKITEDPARHEPLVQMLVQQRRMHPDISACINRRFYDGRLENHASPARTAAVQLDPLPGHGAVVVTLEDVPNAAAAHTASQSRENRGSAQATASLAAWLAADPILRPSVGVITAYADQARQIKQRLKAISDQVVRDRISVGTIHTFQGSERDIIIWDLVETPHLELGKLFREDAGARLVNVAISRARGKLILLGDPAAFSALRPGSARCNSLHNLLTASKELGNRQIRWTRLQQERAIPDLGETRSPAEPRVSPPPGPTPREPVRRVVRPEKSRLR